MEKQISPIVSRGEKKKKIFVNWLQKKKILSIAENNYQFRQSITENNCEFHQTAMKKILKFSQSLGDQYANIINKSRNLQIFSSVWIRKLHY